MRRSRQEILELFVAYKAKVGDTRGVGAFCKATGVRDSEVRYYWPRPAALAEEAGVPKNQFQTRLADECVFSDYAKVCLHWQQVPTQNELRIAQRELKTRTHTVYTRDGSIEAFQNRFRAWLTASDDEKLKPILDFKGWAVGNQEVKRAVEGANPIREPQLHPFLPGCLQYLDVLARGEPLPYERTDVSGSTLFERRTADAFRCLGFEIQQLGQGTGRNADCLACAPREHVALIIDAKVRANGYTLGTQDRQFLDYAVMHGAELLKQGFEKIYLVVVGPSFRESDLTKLGNYLSQTIVRSVVMITARALMRMVEESVRERSTFSLSRVTTELFGNKIISS